MGNGQNNEQPIVHRNYEEEQKNFYEQIFDSLEKNGNLSARMGPINREETDKLYLKESSMVKFRYGEELNGKLSNIGTGFFCKFNYKDIPFEKALFTNNHILNDGDIQIGKKIKLEKLGKEIVITKERKFYTDQKLDYTCIEILDEDNIKNFFEIDSNIFNDIDTLRNEEIFILQFPNDNFSFSCSKILDFRGNKIVHTAVDYNESTCSPIIRRKDNNLYNILGINYGKYTKKDLCILATSFDEIFKDIKLKINSFPYENIIIAKIKTIKDNFNARIINSFENAKREQITNVSGMDNNEEEIKKCEIFINKQKIDFSYYYNFPTQGDYEIIYVFNNLLKSTNFMFFNCEYLNSLDLSRLDTQNVINMGWMFNQCRALTNLNLSNLDTRKVKNMALMFNECVNLKFIDLSSFNTNNVKDMGGMFNRCESLASLGSISGFNTQNVTNMLFMFFGCESLKKLDLSNFNTENVKDMGGMFNRCKSLTELNVRNFNTERVTNMEEMFYYCESLMQLDLSSFKIPRIKNLLGLFADCKSLTNLNVENFVIKDNLDANFIFAKCINLKKGNVIANDRKILNLINN